jgi:uncharacterized protein YjbI with pentapeptide repeats
MAGVDLAGADLCGVDLSGADLRGARMTHARLAGSNLHGAALDGAQLVAADLRGADLSWSGLRAANLSGADLSSADLSHADLRSASLLAADLTGCLLQQADLREALLPCARLSGALVQGANLSWARLQRADLSEADAAGALLNGADLTHADLSALRLDDKSSLRFAFLDQSVLADVKLTRRHLGGGVGEEWVDLLRAADTYDLLARAFAAGRRADDARWARLAAASLRTLSHRLDVAVHYYPLPSGALRLHAYRLRHTLRWLAGGLADRLAGGDARAWADRLPRVTAIEGPRESAVGS